MRYEPHPEISNPSVHLYAPQCYIHPTMVYFSLSSEAHLANKAFKKYLLHIKKKLSSLLLAGKECSFSYFTCFYSPTICSPFVSDKYTGGGGVVMHLLYRYDGSSLSFHQISLKPTRQQKVKKEKRRRIQTDFKHHNFTLFWPELNSGISIYKC